MAGSARERAELFNARDIDPAHCAPTKTPGAPNGLSLLEAEHTLALLNEYLVQVRHNNPLSKGWVCVYVCVTASGAGKQGNVLFNYRSLVNFAGSGLFCCNGSCNCCCAVPLCGVLQVAAPKPLPAGFQVILEGASREASPGGEGAGKLRACLVNNTMFQVSTWKQEKGDCV